MEYYGVQSQSISLFRQSVGPLDGQFVGMGLVIGDAERE